MFLRHGVETVVVWTTEQVCESAGRSALEEGSPAVGMSRGVGDGGGGRTFDQPR